MALTEDEQELDFVHGGVTITTLSKIFGMSTTEVKRRIAGRVKPFPNNGNEILKYAIRAAAPFLVEHEVDLEQVIKNISPTKIPPALQDAFWKAQLSRQKYEENRGDLWRTARVIEVVASAFKSVRMTILMFRDNVQAQEELTAAQQRLIVQMSDGLLIGLHQALTEEFKNHKPKDDEHGESPTVAAEKYEDDGLGEAYDDGLGDT